jgi:LysM repeat protein
VDPEQRRELKRYGVPAAFLVAVTIAVLLVKSGLDDAEPSATPTAPTTTAQTTTSQTTTKLVLTGTGTGATTTAPSNAQYYVIQSGDTLGGIATQYDTTVEQLLTLNPDVDPSALQPGQRLRVG